ncbi:hypothetical protein KSI01_12140 [Kurthia sibirica]|nr:hypothetical protein KSI01_12140 [Kurthia sibirica]
MPKVGMVEDVSNIALFLISGESSLITDGGWRVYSYEKKKRARTNGLSLHVFLLFY